MADKSQKPSKPNDRIDDKATEKEALDPSVAEKSQTDAKGKAEIDKEITNASSGSLGFDEGITAIRFEIDDDGKTIASKDVRSEQSDLDDSEDDGESLTVELEALKRSDNQNHAELAQNIEVMRTQAKQKGISTEAIDEYAKETFSKPVNQEEQFERGSHKALSSEVTDQKPLDPNDKPEGGFEQENRTDGGITLKAGISNEPEKNWHTVVEKISKLPLDQQLKIIGTGLQAFDNELNRQKLEIALGTVEGVGEGFKSLGDGVLSLANGLGQIGQFSADVLTNNPRSIETSANAGEAIGKTLVSGVKLFQMSHDYLYNIGFTGDYSKPFNDVANLGNELNRRWQEMPTRERAKIAAKLSTETLASMAIPLGANKLAKTEKVTELMEEFAIQAKRLGKESKAVGAIEETVEDLTKVNQTTEQIEVPKKTGRKKRAKDDSESRGYPDESESSQMKKQGEMKEIIPPSAGFINRVSELVETLAPNERAFLKAKNIEVVPVNKITDVIGDEGINFGGLYREGKIYLAEVSSKTGFPITDHEFIIRHEFGHALNANTFKFGDWISNQKDFRHAFKIDFEKHTEIEKNSLYLSEKHKVLELARDEVFADLYAHSTGVLSNNPYSIKMKEKFPNCLKYFEDLKNVRQ